METPTGFFATLWSFMAFLPFFVLLLILGVLKAIIFSPVALIVIGIGNWAVIVGLWPVHLIWTYYYVAKTKLLGPFLKFVIFAMLPMPLFLWLAIGGVGSIVVGISYGICSPLMATFAAVGEGKSEKFKQCFVSGTWSTVLGSCTVVRDFADVCYHSYFSTLIEIRDRPPKSGKPLDINLSQIPGCMLVGLLGIIIDVPIITVIAVYKSPFMLFKGWKQLLRDLIGRAGPFLETACVPFAGLSIILWPLAVVFSVLGAILSSFFLGIYASAIVYQEASIHRGLAYIVAAIALFDEYTNDLLYLREGTCFPRPKYRKESASDAVDNLFPDSSISKVQKHPPQRVSSFSDAWQELKAVQIWNSIFEACEEWGKVLYQDGVITEEDLKDWKRSDRRILNIGLPAYVLLQCFLRSIKSNKPGFVLRDGKVLTRANRPEGRAFDFFWEPMSIMLEQLKILKLHESEELYLSKLVLTGGDSERMEKWHNGGIPPADDIRRGQLQGISKRIHGFATTLSRMPTFRRRFEDVVKAISKAADEMKKSSEELV